MRYEGRIFRPPSEADAYILQATLGCSWNHCTYCDMYRDRTFAVRDLDATLADIHSASVAYGNRVRKIFVADGDALVMDLDTWRQILTTCRACFPGLRRISAYATALNLIAKSVEELRELRELGLSLLYVGPESGDDPTLRRIAKGADYADHVEGARRAHSAGMQLSTIFLLGSGGVDRSQEHAEGTARLISDMDPAYVSLLTLTVLPDTPLGTMQERGKFELPSIHRMLEELCVIVGQAAPTDAIFRTNHASNYLPIAGNLPRDRERIVAVAQRALAGEMMLRPEWARGL